MSALVRAELAKVMSTRLVWGLLAGQLVFIAVNVVALVVMSGQQGVPPVDSESGTLAVFSSAASATVFSLVLGVIAVSGEFRHGTITSTFLAVPRRGRVLAAKLVALPMVTAMYGAAGVAVTAGLAYPLLAWKGVDVAATAPDVPRALLGAFAAVTLYSMLGVGFGALIRNQVAAVISALLWVMLVESTLVAYLPVVGKWTPGGAASAMTLAQTQRGGDLLPQWAGALLFVGYGVLLAAVAARWTLRRDVT